MSQVMISDVPQAEPYGIPRMLVKYRTIVIPAIKDKYKNVMEIPRLQKISVNMGVGQASKDIKELDNARRELSIITGQAPYTRRAKNAISTFKIREGMPVGCAVTLRGNRMWEFMDRLVNIALPRVRDFRGLSGKSFDGRGNYSFGVKDHSIFVELDYTDISAVRGMDITFVTTAKNDADAKELLKSLGMPFRN